MQMPGKDKVVAAFKSKGLATYPYAIEVFDDKEISVKFHKLGKSGTSGDDESKLKEIASQLGAKGHVTEGNTVTLYWSSKEKPISEATDPNEPEQEDWQYDGPVTGEQLGLILDFILNTRDIDDEKFHAFVEGELGLEAHDAETVVYKSFQAVMESMAEEEGQFGDPVEAGQDAFHYGDEPEMQPVTEDLTDDEDKERFAEIRDEIKELVSEAMQIVRRNSGKVSEDRAKAYWYAQIVMALDDDHQFLGSGSHTMQDTLAEFDATTDDGETELDPNNPDNG